MSIVSFYNNFQKKRNLRDNSESHRAEDQKSWEAGKL